MKRIVISLLLLVAVWGRPAWASYNARESELLAELDARKNITPQERELLKRAFQAYFPLRQRCLEDLLKIVGDPNPNQKEAGKEWPRRVEACRNETASALGGVLSDVKEPSAEAVELLVTARIAEDKFWGALAGVTAADKRDQMVTINVRLVEQIDVLDKKWRSFVESDKTLDQLLKDTSKEVQTAFAEVAKEFAERHRAIVEKGGQLVEKLTGSELVEWPSTGNATVDTLIAVMNGLINAATKVGLNHNRMVQERYSRAINYMQQESTFIVMFARVREEVSAFLEANDFPRVKQAYDDALRSIDTFVNAGLTSAQKNDAGEFRDRAVKALGDEMEDVEDVYERFVKNNKEKFYGPISSAIKEELLESRWWEDEANKFASRNVDAELRKLYDNVGRFYEINLSGLKSAQRDALKKDFAAELEREAAALTEDINVYNSYVKGWREQRKQLEDKLD